MVCVGATRCLHGPPGIVVLGGYVCCRNASGLWTLCAMSWGGSFGLARCSQQDWSWRDMGTTAVFLPWLHRDSRCARPPQTKPPLLSSHPFPFDNCIDSKPTKDEDQLVPLCTLAALPTFIRSRKRPANMISRPRDPPSPRSAKAAAEAVEAEARVCEMEEAHIITVVLFSCLPSLFFLESVSGRGG